MYTLLYITKKRIRKRRKEQTKKGDKLHFLKYVSPITYTVGVLITRRSNACTSP